jgi:hypothetical protein
MVITPTSSDGSSTISLEQVEPVKDDPSIGDQRQPVVKEKVIEESIGASTPASSLENLCKNAHSQEVVHLATQLGVDIK